MNCCFILRPQFGQLRLLALIKVYWSLATISSADIPLASSFFNTDSASAFLDSSAAFFSAATFFASALESSFAATFKADFLLFICSFSTLMLSDSAAISVSICSLAAVFSATIAACDSEKRERPAFEGRTLLPHPQGTSFDLSHRIRTRSHHPGVTSLHSLLPLGTLMVSAAEVTYSGGCKDRRKHYGSRASARKK